MHGIKRQCTTEVADPSGRVVYGGGLRSITCWDFICESRQQHAYVSVLSETSASGWSPFQRSPTDGGCVFVCDLGTSAMRQLWPALGCWAKEEENLT
jgi:hypothetical protein